MGGAGGQIEAKDQGAVDVGLYCTYIVISLYSSIRYTALVCNVVDTRTRDACYKQHRFRRRDTASPLLNVLCTSCAGQVCSVRGAATNPPPRRAFRS